MVGVGAGDAVIFVSLPLEQATIARNVPTNANDMMIG
jgi:hypothetical protein